MLFAQAQVKRAKTHLPKERGSAKLHDVNSFEIAVIVHTRNGARVGTFLQVARLGLPHAQRTLSEETDSYFEMMVEDDHNRDFLDYVTRVGTDGYVQSQVKDAQSAVDAAAVVFMHSILDDTATTCCRLFAEAKPQDFEYWVGDKQVALREIREVGYDSLFQKALEKRLVKLERESLLVKADMIMRLCRPPKEYASNVKNYAYDRDRLVRLDEERHKLVHGGRWASSFRRNDEDLEYLYNTGVYFIDLVSFSCNPRDLRTKRREAHNP